MPIFAIELEDHESATLYMMETADRLKSPNLVKNPFTSNSILKRISKFENKNTYLFILESIYPPFYIIGLFGFIMTYLFLGWSWWTFPGAFVFSLGIFWTFVPPYLALRYGLKKAGYRGRVRLLRKNEIIKRCIYFQY